MHIVIGYQYNSSRNSLFRKMCYNYNKRIGICSFTYMSIITFLSWLSSWIFRWVITITKLLLVLYNYVTGFEKTWLPHIIIIIRNANFNHLKLHLGKQNRCYMWLSGAKPRHVHVQTEIHFITPAYSYTKQEWGHRSGWSGFHLTTFTELHYKVK